MFAFATTPVKFVGLIVLFAWCTVWCVREVVRPQSVRQRVASLLHLAMAAVMLLMVWGGTWTPLVAMVGLWPLVVGFAAATGWFVVSAVQERRAGQPVGHAVGHALMFAAMTWHLAAMAVMHMAMSGQGSHGMGHGGSMGGGGMDAAGPAVDMGQWMAQASAPGGVLWLFALVGVPLMAYLVAAGLNDIRRALRPAAAASACACGGDCACGPGCTCAAHVPASEEVLAHGSSVDGHQHGAARVLAPESAFCHAPRPVGTPGYRAAALADAAMNLGMFWMSTGLLVAIAPFMGAFSF